MYIQPNTTIRLIKNCPLDPTYDHTIYFTSKAAQVTFFTRTLDGYLFDKQTYQRVNKGKLRVARNADGLYQCNYLAFQNSAFGDKWFYAFITAIEYVNNETSEISYEMDVMQTWHFDYTLKDCFVEREHSLTDAIGDNIVDEGLATGEYIIDNYSEPSAMTTLSIVLFSTGDWQELVPGVRTWKDIGMFVKNTVGGKYPTGLKPIVFPLTTQGIEDCNAWINDLPITKQNALVGACIMPTFVATSASMSDHTVQRVTTLLRSDGTNVKNNKCLTYPYNFLYVTNYQGNTASYRYEFFIIQNTPGHENDIDFTLRGGYGNDPSVYATPYGYKNSYEDNLDEAIQISGFPQIPFNMDAFKAWLAQNASSIGLSALAIASSGAEAAVSLAPGGAHTMPNPGVHLQGGNGAVVRTGNLGTIGALYAVNTVISGAMAAAAPPQSHGSTNSAGQYSAGFQTYGFMNKHITPEYATIIDDFFSMYGYACRKVKVPNRNARPEWNYVKTIGCVIDGGVPADDISKICEIYNNGITFWNNPAHIGDYSLSNPAPY